eukprot:GHVU01214012.1.p1 GENE.GHVU01214012.1~~GHVU01214012.1.p1  ORF type:complete len:152 (-),score=16.28 GHVU01214012.1:543-998(-)
MLCRRQTSFPYAEPSLNLLVEMREEGATNPGIKGWFEELRNNPKRWKRLKTEASRTVRRKVAPISDKIRKELQREEVWNPVMNVLQHCLAAESNDAESWIKEINPQPKLKERIDEQGDDREAGLHAAQVTFYWSFIRPLVRISEPMLKYAT